MDNQTIDKTRSKQSLRLWLKLLDNTNRIEKTLRGKLRTEFASTLPRFDVLAELSRRPDGVTMGELSSMLMVSNGNLTGLAKRLQSDGLILRAPLQSDKRTHLLYITSKGTAAFNKMAKEHEQWIAALFYELEDYDIDILISLLNKMNITK